MGYLFSNDRYRSNFEYSNDRYQIWLSLLLFLLKKMPEQYLLLRRLLVNPFSL